MECSNSGFRGLVSKPSIAVSARSTQAGRNGSAHGGTGLDEYRIKGQELAVLLERGAQVPDRGPRQSRNGVLGWFVLYDSGEPAHVQPSHIRRGLHQCGLGARPNG